MKESEVICDPSSGLFLPVKIPLILSVHELCNCVVEKIERYCDGTEERRKSEFFLYKVLPRIRECIFSDSPNTEMTLPATFAPSFYYHLGVRV